MTPENVKCGQMKCNKTSASYAPYKLEIQHNQLSRNLHLLADIFALFTFTLLTDMEKSNRGFLSKQFKEQKKEKNTDMDRMV